MLTLSICTDPFLFCPDTEGRTFLWLVSLLNFLTPDEWGFIVIACVLFPLFLPQEKQLSGQPPFRSPKPCREGISCLPCSEGSFSCRRQWSHRYLQASASESSLGDLTDNPRLQNAAYQVPAKAVRPDWSSAMSINKNGHGPSWTFPEEHVTNFKE